jgi:hypothetical protein
MPGQLRVRLAVPRGRAWRIAVRPGRSVFEENLSPNRIQTLAAFEKLAADYENRSGARMLSVANFRRKLQERLRWHARLGGVL